MPVIRSIYGDEIEVGLGACPEVHRRLPRTAVRVCEVRRGENFWMELIDIYYLARSRQGRHWVLWLSCRDPDNRGRIVRRHRPLTWSPVSGVETKSIAAAMLEFIWSAGDLSDENLEITGAGLLSEAACREIAEIASGVFLKREEPFVEPDEAGGITLREAGPNHPVYRRGWIFGGRR